MAEGNVTIKTTNDKTNDQTFTFHVNHDRIHGDHGVHDFFEAITMPIIHHTLSDARKLVVLAPTLTNSTNIMCDVLALFHKDKSWEDVVSIEIKSPDLRSKVQQVGVVGESANKQLAESYKDWIDKGQYTAKRRCEVNVPKGGRGKKSSTRKRVSDEKVRVSPDDRVRPVYVGPRGGRYVKIDGKFKSLKDVNR